jgi:hypothetical protein
MPKYNAIHIWLSDEQMAVIQARAKMEYKPMTHLVRNAALDYCAYGPIIRRERPPKPVLKLIDALKEKDGTDEGL